MIPGGILVDVTTVDDTAAVVVVVVAVVSSVMFLGTQPNPDGHLVSAT